MSRTDDGRRSAAARKRSAERIARVKPWLRSTGPRTAEGKRTSSAQATKHGRYSAPAKAEASALRTLFRSLKKAREALR